MNYPQPFPSSKKPPNAFRTQVDQNDKNTWSALLDSVASGKRLPEKRVVVLGGSSNIQRDFVRVLGSDSLKITSDRQKKRPPIANEFALGYTYQDVLDVDHEDILARLSIYTLQDSAPAFTPLLQSLLTPAVIPESLLVILLDWSHPWSWARQIRDWIQLLHRVLSTLDDGSKTIMQEVMQDWQQRRRGGAYDTGGASTNADMNVNVPLGPGEWDEALGLPLCVVCHNSEQIDVLEREHGWREEDFDYVLQFLRTILLKHGASLIYTSSSMPNSLPLLVQSSLGIHSILKRQLLKHNVVDREKVLIPPNWDSWGKIRVLRDGFDVESISSRWSLEIQPSETKANGTNVSTTEPLTKQHDGESIANGPVADFENTIRVPSSNKPKIELSPMQSGVEVDTVGMQDFLAKQADAIERLKVEEEQAAKDVGREAANNYSDISLGSNFIIEDTSRVKEHVGPIQFNMGGIQLDAEDMLNRIKDRGSKDEVPQSPQKERASMLSPGVNEQGKPRQEALASFFAGLIKKSGGSAPSTPPPKDKSRIG